MVGDFMSGFFPSAVSSRLTRGLAHVRARAPSGGKVSRRVTTDPVAFLRSLRALGAGPSVRLFG